MVKSPSALGVIAPAAESGLEQCFPAKVRWEYHNLAEDEIERFLVYTLRSDSREIGKDARGRAEVYVPEIGICQE